MNLYPPKSAVSERDSKLASLFLTGLVIVVLLGIVFITPLACTSEDSSKDVLERAGYRDVEVGGYGWFACSTDDKYATKFRAKNPQGQVVEGVVCCGLWKSCTVRF